MNLTISEIFGPTSLLTPLGFFIRATIVYFGMVFFIRVVGKILLGRFSVVSFTMAITIGSIAALPLAAPEFSVRVALVQIAVITVLAIVVQTLSFRSIAFRKWIFGGPLVLVENGHILEDNLAAARFNVDNLLSKLREKNAPDIGDVEFAILEPTGEFSVIKKSQKEPVRNKDLKIATPYRGLPLILVYDGQIDRENLASAGKDEVWLFNQLEQKGIIRLQDVLLASLNTSGDLYVDYIQPRKPNL